MKTKEEVSEEWKTYEVGAVFHVKDTCINL